MFCVPFSGAVFRLLAVARRLSSGVVCWSEIAVIAVFRRLTSLTRWFSRVGYWWEVSDSVLVSRFRRKSGCRESCVGGSKAAAAQCPAFALQRCTQFVGRGMIGHNNGLGGCFGIALQRCTQFA